MKETMLIRTTACVFLLAVAYAGHPLTSWSVSSPEVSAAVITTGRIAIDPSRWYQVVNSDNGLAGLFDGVTSVPVNTGYGKLLSNYDAYYPLLPGETWRIESIRFYDGEGSNPDAPLTLSIITDKWERIPIARFIGDQYNQWVGPDPTKPNEFRLATPVANARYLVLNTSGAYPSEMELYGSFEPGTAPTPTPAKSVPFRQAIGANMFEWNIESANAPWEIDESRIPVLKGFSAVRHYADWDKLEPQQGNYTFQPTYNGSWNYDAMYERLHAEGIEVLTCIKSIPDWLQNTYPDGQRDNENVPAPYGSDLSKPASYTALAKVGFQFAARYGSNKNVNPSLVRVSPITTWAGTNVVRIGMGVSRYIECENERDKTWKGRKAYQTAREYAATLSAFYDGHNHTLGPDVGVKTADSTMIVVIGGLAASSTDYVRAMVDWCREFRGYYPDGRVNLCWDVINQHLYANDTRSSQNGGNSRGAAPELSAVATQAAAFVKMAHEVAYDMPVWLTEAGYDVNQGSPFKAIAIGAKSVLQTQADWILRTALLYTRVGIDRLFFYQLYDDNAENPTQFYSMGLINGDKTRKPAADYLYQARALIGNYSYKETLNADPLVDRYETKDISGQPQSAYVLTIPDERGRTAIYNLPVKRGDTVQVCTPSMGRDTMTRTLRVSLTGQLAINVSETPVFVIPSPRITSQLANDIESGLASLIVSLNPTTDNMDVAFTNASSTPVEVAVYGAASGQQYNRLNLPKPDRLFSTRIDLGRVPVGPLIVEIRQGQARVNRRVIKTH